MARLKRTSLSKNRFDISTKEGLAYFAASKGFTKEAEQFIKEPKLSFLQRISRIFTAFETANAYYENRYNNKSFLSTYAKDIAKDIASSITGTDYRISSKKTWKDVLIKEGMKDRPGKIDPVDITGLAADILLDPTTWIGGYIGKAIKKTGKISFSISKKLPKIGQKIVRAENLTRGLFEPFYKIKKLGKEGNRYIDEYMKFVKGVRFLQNDFLENISKKAKKFKKPKIIGKKIAIAVETGKKTGNKLIDETINILINTQKALTKQEIKRGILKKQLPNYLHHMLTSEAADFMSSGGDLMQFLKSIKVKLGAAKSRNILGIIHKINKKYKKQLGFNLFEEDAFKAFAKRGIDSIKAVETYDFLKRIGNQFGKKAKQDFIDEVGIKWTTPKLTGISKKALGNVKLPEPISKHILDINNILTNEKSTKELLKLYDKALSVFKGSVTGWFPSFHTRNALGGIFNNWIAGLKNPIKYVQAENILKGKKGILKVKGGKDISFDTIRGMLKEYGVVGQTGFLDVNEFLKKSISESAAEKIQKLPQKAMGFIEDRLRVPLFIDSLSKGLDPVDAARKVIKYHFDYAPEGLTYFERHVMKRVIPFWTFTRHNIPLQIEQMIMQPAKYAGVMKTFRVIGPKTSTEEEFYLPSWLKNRFIIKNEGGYWSGFGLPFEEAIEKLAEPLRGFGISLSPFIKVPIERLTGYNIFKERRIDKDIYGKHYRNLPKPFKKWLQVKKHTSANGENYYTMNPNRKYWLEVVASRGLATALRVSNYTEDKKNLLSLITTIRKYDYTIDDLKRWSETEQREKLEKLLQEAGELKMFNKAYIPK